MATIRLLLCIFWFAISGSFSLLSSHLLTQTAITKQSDLVQETTCRLKIVSLAVCELGIREQTGRNDGKRVEAYLRLVNLHKGDPYCAAFVSFIFAEEGFAKPRSGWSPDLFPTSRITKSALPGNVIGIYFPEYKRIAHVGIIERIHHDWCMTIEANTNVSGSREGQGVYRRLRHMKTIYRIADWIKPGRRSP